MLFFYRKKPWSVSYLQGKEGEERKVKTGQAKWEEDQKEEETVLEREEDEDENEEGERKEEEA